MVAERRGNFKAFLTLTLYRPLASLLTCSGLMGERVRSSGRRMSSRDAMQSTNGMAWWKCLGYGVAGGKVIWVGTWVVRHQQQPDGTVSCSIQGCGVPSLKCHGYTTLHCALFKPALTLRKAEVTTSMLSARPPWVALKACESSIKANSALGNVPTTSINVGDTGAFISHL